MYEDDYERNASDPVAGNHGQINRRAASFSVVVRQTAGDPSVDDQITVDQANDQFDGDKLQEFEAEFPAVSPCPSDEDEKEGAFTEAMTRPMVSVTTIYAMSSAVSAAESWNEGKLRNILSTMTEEDVKKCRYNRTSETNKYYPIFVVKDLVKLALDKEKPPSNFSKIARTDAVFSFNIKWNCNFDYDESECKPEYEFRRMDSTDEKIAKGWNFRHTDYWNAPDRTRRKTFYKYYGRDELELYSTPILLFVLFLFQGSLAKFLADFTATDHAPMILSTRAVVSLDNQHAAWPQPDGIPYRLDGRYSQQDQAAVVGALNEIQNNMQQCIKFVPYNPATDAQKPNIYIGPMTTPLENPNSGALFPGCFAFPGVVVRGGRPVSSGQKLGLVNGTHRCLENKRDTMKYIVNALGLRDEWRRPDRDNYITVNLVNVRTDVGVPPVDLIRKYHDPITPVDTRPSPQTIVNLTAFDYNSITMPALTKFTLDPSKPLYTIVPGRVQTLNGVANTSVTAAGSLAQLSRDDCEGLKAIYASTCANIVCPDPYGSGPTQTTGRIFSIKYGKAARFEDAVVNENWRADSVSNERGPMCMQNPSQPPFTLTGVTAFAEDCLYLDVYVPPGFLTPYYCSQAGLTGGPVSALCQNTTKLPVFMWSWGGLLSSNGRGLPNGGGDLAKTLNVVVVIPQYRTGVFGFLSTGDSAIPGNYALSDMKAAFNWVYQYIDQWNGDRDRITVSGQSDGAAIVSAMMIDRTIASRVFGTITMSGSVLSPWAIKEGPLTNAVGLGARGGCATTPTSSLAACLKGLDALTLRTLADAYFADPTIPHAPGSPFWSMVIDTKHIPGDPAVLLADRSRKGLTGGFLHTYSKQDAAVVALVAFGAPALLGNATNPGPTYQFILGGAIPALMSEEVQCAIASIPLATRQLVATTYGMTPTSTPAVLRTQLFQMATDLNHGLVASIKEAQLYSISEASRTGNSISVLAFDGNVSLFSPLTGGTPAGGGFPGLGAYHTLDVGYLFAGPMTLFVSGQADAEVTRVLRSQFNSVITTGRGLGAPFDPALQNFIELGQDRTYQPRNYQRAIQMIAFWDRLKQLGCNPADPTTSPELTVSFAGYP
ncbi:putative Bile salt-activated lipase [Hypsibius exemplaris]|uniref:Bile salt-activated lipase n=1 Tax=Hypsibius exemplaris TaxID=2072580 RepID=A0A9X6ND82_HYPEX|nr:putative Bile salt-activated lipase [Hypsibius exemplaris]